MNITYKFITILLLLSSCSYFNSGNWESKAIQIKPDDISVIIKYKKADKQYYNTIKSGTEEMLDTINIYYFNEGKEYYLGRIDRTGVYNTKGISIYKMPDEIKEPYVSIRNIEFPTSVNFIEQQDGKYQESDTRVNLKLNLSELTIEISLPDL